MGSLRQDLAPYTPQQDLNGVAAQGLPHDIEEDDDEWSDEDDDAMILGTTPHVSHA